MVRILVDTRNCCVAYEAAFVAAKLGLGLVALVTEKTRDKKLVSEMQMAVEDVGWHKPVRQLCIPEHSPSAARALRKIKKRGDILVTETSILAHELVKGRGHALNSWGERYTKDNIHELVDAYWENQKLSLAGHCPYAPRAHTASNTDDFLDGLEQVLSQIMQSDDCRNWKPLISDTAFRFQGKVYVDGDSCPMVPEIIELCGAVHAPIVFVTNGHSRSSMEKHLKGSRLCVDESWMPPPVKTITVPVKKDAVDKYIAGCVGKRDIVITRDLRLTQQCLLKDATVIDDWGRLYQKEIGSGGLSIKELRSTKRTDASRSFTSRSRHGKSVRFKHTFFRVLTTC